jgi:2-octaprenylphenol hydroxylase
MRGGRSLDFDIIIVGGGVAGAALAALLLNRGLCARGRVALIADHFATAPSAEADWDLRVFAMSRASERILKQAGAWQSLPASRVSAYERMCVWDAQGSPQGQGHLRFDCAEIGEPNLGYIVDGAALQWRCVQGAQMAGATLIDAPLLGLAATPERITVRLGDDREFSAQLVVGADGSDSTVRRLLEVPTAGHAYHQDALVGHVQTAKPHEHTAWQRFLPGGPLAFLPLADGRCSIVWSVARSESARLCALDPQAFNAELTAASDAVLGRCALTTALAAFPLKLQYALHYVQTRAVLLGDAAHAVHPLAGQGLNLGLMDCAALIQVLSEAGGPERAGDWRVLRRYERWRRSENLLAAAALDGLERLFAHPSRAVAGLRKTGLGALERSPMLKQRLVRQALGLSGDVPDLVRADLSVRADLA